MEITTVGLDLANNLRLVLALRRSKIQQLV
jgi:hypothetical protein